MHSPQISCCWIGSGIAKSQGATASHQTATKRSAVELRRASRFLTGRPRSNGARKLAEKARTIFPQPQIGTPKAYSLASQWASGGTQDLAFRLIAIELWSVPTCPPWTLGCCFPGRMHIDSMQAFKPLVGDRQPKGSASGELPCVFGDVGVLYQNASRSAS